MKGSRLFGPLKVGEKAWRGKPVTGCGVRCYLTPCKVKCGDNKPELQLIISYDQETCPINEYGPRWQIETMFRGMKSSAFNLEDTHLKHIERVARQFCLVMIAYTRAYKTGVHLHETIRNIPVKSHGRRAKKLCEIWT